MDSQITEALIEALATVEGSDSESEEWVLHDYISADALNMLAKHDGAPWILKTQVNGYSVKIHSEGTIFIDDHMFDVEWAEASSIPEQ